MLPPAVILPVIAADAAFAAIAAAYPGAPTGGKTITIEINNKSTRVLAVNENISAGES